MTNATCAEKGQTNLQNRLYLAGIFKARFSEAIIVSFKRGDTNGQGCIV